MSIKSLYTMEGNINFDVETDIKVNDVPLSELYLMKDDQFITNQPIYNKSTSTGIISGGVIEKLTDTTIKINTGSGIINSSNGLYLVEWETSTETINNLSTHNFSHVYIDNTGTPYFSLIYPTPALQRSYIYLGKIVHNRTAGTILLVFSQPKISKNPTNALNDVIDNLSNFIKLEGLTITGTPSTLNINMSSGKIYGSGINYETDPDNPHIKTLSAQIPINCVYSLLNNTSYDNSNNIDVNYYENTSTGRTLLSNNKYGSHYIFLYPSGNIRLQYGQAEYDKIEDAVSSIDTITLLDNIKDNAFLLGVVVAKKGITDLTADPTQSKIYLTDFFGSPRFGSASISLTASLSLQDAYNNGSNGEVLLTSAIKPVIFKASDGSEVLRIDDDKTISTPAITLNGTDLQTTLNSKADTSAFTNYYNKTETDNLLNLKADLSDFVDLSTNLNTNYYNKTTTDTLLNGKQDTLSLTADKILISDINGDVVASTVDSNDLAYGFQWEKTVTFNGQLLKPVNIPSNLCLNLSDVRSSNYQLDISGGFNANIIWEGETSLIDKYSQIGHIHSISDITGLNTELMDLSSGIDLNTADILDLSSSLNDLSGAVDSITIPETYWTATGSSTDIETNSRGTYINGYAYVKGGFFVIDNSNGTYSTPERMLFLNQNGISTDTTIYFNNSPYDCEIRASYNGNISLSTYSGSMKKRFTANQTGGCIVESSSATNPLLINTSGNQRGLVQDNGSKQLATYIHGSTGCSIGSTTNTDFSIFTNGTSNNWLTVKNDGQIVANNTSFNIVNSGGVSIPFSITSTSVANEFLRFLNINGAGLSIKQDSSNNYSIGVNSPHNFSLYTNASDRLTILSGGNIGIGQTTPGCLLHVGSCDVTNNPSVAVSDRLQITSTSADIMSLYDTQSAYVRIGAWNKAGSTSKLLSLNTNGGGVSIQTSDEDGQLLIGDRSRANTLTLNDIQYAKYKFGTGGYAFNIRKHTGTSNSDYASYEKVFVVSATNRATTVETSPFYGTSSSYDANRFVVWTPSNDIAFNGNGSVYTSAKCLSLKGQRLNWNSGGTVSYESEIQIDGGRATNGTVVNGQIRMYTATNERLTITENGKVGIGTTTGTIGQLHVNIGDGPSNPSYWDGNCVVFGRGGGAYQSAIGFSYVDSENRGYIYALAPSVAWRALALKCASLDLGAGIATYIGANVGISVYSDDRLKDNEEYLTGALETLMKIKPEIYDKRLQLEADPLIPIEKQKVKEAGIIIQQIYYDAPELRFLIHTSEDANISEDKPVGYGTDPNIEPDFSDWGTKPASFNYNGLIAYLIKAVQELKTENDNLKNTIETQQTTINNILSRLEALENP